MTNLLAILHTTAACQTAVLQLMIGEANFAARQLGLSERVPVVTNELVSFHVSPPPFGVTGTVSSTNYGFSFRHGRLTKMRSEIER